MLALELFQTEGRAELGVASELSLVAFESPAPMWSFPECQTSAGFGLLSHAAWAWRGGAGVTQRRPCGIPFRFLLAHPSCPPGRAEAEDHCPSLDFAPTPKMHLQTSRAPSSTVTRRGDLSLPGAEVTVLPCVALALSSEPR